jgi:hypothetical protein
MIAMIIKTATSLAFITVCLATIATMPAGHAQMMGNTGGSEVVTNGPQTSPGDTSGSWSARQNVIQSERYDRLLETNRGFREARMRRECGPITDQELHQQCLASFQQDTPFMGSSSPRNNYRSGSGR